MGWLLISPIKEYWQHLSYQGSLIYNENSQHFILPFLQEYKYSNVAIRNNFKRLEQIAVSFHGNGYEINHYLKTNVSLLVLEKSAD